MARTWSAVLARLGTPTGDGRILTEGGITSRDLPLPLLYQAATDDGHGGSIVVGRIESIEFGNGMVTARGSMLAEQGWAAMESIEAGVIGPSVDLDDIEYVMDADERIVITRGRIAGATLVAIPAFADVSITLDPLPAEPLHVPEWVEESAYADYAAGLAAFAITAAPTAFELLPPAEWFAPPEFGELTPLTVTTDGRVFGHIAPWGECHVGLPGVCDRPAVAVRVRVLPHRGAAPCGRAHRRCGDVGDGAAACGRAGRVPGRAGALRRRRRGRCPGHRGGGRVRYLGGGVDAPGC